MDTSMGRRMAYALRLLLALSLALRIVTGGDAHAGGVPVATATEHQKRDANRLYESGSAKSQSGDARGAFADFRASYDIVASPNTRLRMGRELAAQGRWADAYREARATEAMAKEATAADKKYVDTERSARDDAARYGSRCGFVRIALVGREGQLMVGGRAVAESEQSAPIAVDAGEVEVTFRERGVVATRRVHVTPGGEVSVSFAQMEQKGPAPRREAALMHPFDMGEGQVISGYVVGGVGVVGAALFIGFGAANLQAYSDVDDRCPNAVCPASLEAEVDEGRTFQTAANVGLVIGAVGLAGGAALLIPALIWGDDGSRSARIQIGPGHAALEVRLP